MRLWQDAQAGFSRCILEDVAQRGIVALELAFAGLERRYVRGRWRRRRSQEIGEHEQTALHGRGAIGIGRDQQRAALREHAAARAAGRQRDLAHLRAGDAGQAVELCELLVDEGVVAVDQLGDGTVFGA